MLRSKNIFRCDAAFKLATELMFIEAVVLLRRMKQPGIAGISGAGASLARSLQTTWIKHLQPGDT
jgi:hypothetical protein